MIYCKGVIVFLIFLWGLLFPFFCSANENLWKQAHRKQIAYHPYWLRLLHYHFPFESPGQWVSKSDVKSPEFFLASDGNTNPESELKATLAGFLAPISQQPDQHAQCKFKARFEWLKTQLDFSQTSLPQVSCPLFERWANLDHLDSIDVVFVSAYMDNPASIYGHILIKFNSTDRYFGHSLLSPTLNFGAVVDPSDGIMSYALKGLLGGYYGRFTDERFYNFNHLYGEAELRDLWIYELNFNENQKRRIVYHTWELLQGVNFDYYFLLDNCAYRMGELLEIAWDEERVNPSFSLWSIPVNIFHRINEIENNGSPLVKNIRLQPSRQRRLQDKVSALSSKQKGVMLDIIRQFEQIKSEKFLKLSDMEKAQVLDALIDYYQYRRADQDSPELRLYRRRILLLRSQLPVIQPQSVSVSSPAPPTEGSPPTRLRLALQTNKTLGNALEVGLRSSYHDLIGDTTGHLPNAQLSTLDLRLRFSSENVTVQQFEFFNIQSLSIAPTGLPADNGWSWHGRGAIERKYLDCQICKVLTISGGFGKAASLTSKDVWFAFLDVFFQTPTLNAVDVSIGGTPLVGMTFTPYSTWKILFISRYMQSLVGPQIKLPEYRLENRWTLSSKWDVRLEWIRNWGEELSLAVNYYW